MLNPSRTYLSTSIKTASQGQLLLMLFDGAIRFCKEANESMVQGNYEKANNNIGRAQAIINELMVSLNMEIGGEMTKNIFNLYDYIYRRLITANVKKDSQIVSEVISLLTEFREIWQMVVKKTNDRQTTMYNSK